MIKRTLEQRIARLEKLLKTKNESRNMMDYRVGRRVMDADGATGVIVDNGPYKGLLRKWKYKLANLDEVLDWPNNFMRPEKAMGTWSVIVEFEDGENAGELVMSPEPSEALELM